MSLKHDICLCTYVLFIPVTTYRHLHRCQCLPGATIIPLGKLVPSSLFVSLVFLFAEILTNTSEPSDHRARKTVMETVKVCLRAPTGAVLLKGWRFLGTEVGGGETLPEHNSGVWRPTLPTMCRSLSYSCSHEVQTKAT